MFVPFTLVHEQWIYTGLCYGKHVRIALCKRCFDLGPMVYVHPYFLIGTFCLGYSDKYIALCDLFGPHICPYFM